MKQGFNITKCERNYVIFPDALYVSGNECVFVLMFSCFPSLLWPLTWARHLCPHNCCLLFTFLSLTLDILRKSLEAEWALSEIFRTTWHHQTKDTKFKDTKMTLFHKVCLHCPLEEQLFCRIENFKQVVLVFKYRLGRNVLFKKSTEKCRIQLKEHIRLALKTVLCLLFVHYLSFCLFSSDLKTLRVFFAILHLSNQIPTAERNLLLHCTVLVKCYPRMTHPGFS